MILDAGILISIDRDEHRAQDFIAAATSKRTLLRVTEPVLAQVWRGDPKQHHLAKFIATLDIHPFSDWKQVGSLLTGSTSPDVVDAHMVVLAIKLGDNILTGDPDDLNNITGTLGRIAPVIYEW